MGNRHLKPIIAHERKDFLRGWDAHDGRKPLSYDAPQLKVSDQRIEALVLGNDVKLGGGVLGGKYADVVGDVKIESIGASGFKKHVFGVRSQRVKRCREGGRNLRLTRAL